MRMGAEGSGMKRFLNMGLAVLVGVVLLFVRELSAIDFPAVDLQDKKATEAAFKWLNKEYKGAIIAPKFHLPKTPTGTCHVRLWGRGSINVNDRTPTTNLPEVRSFTISEIKFNREKNRIDISGEYNGKFKLAIEVGRGGIGDAAEIMERLFYSSFLTTEQIEIERSKLFADAVGELGFVPEETPALRKIAYWPTFITEDMDLAVEIRDDKRFLAYVIYVDSRTEYNTVKANKQEMIKRDFDENVRALIIPPLLNGAVSKGDFKTLEGVVVRFSVNHRNFVGGAGSSSESGAYKCDLYLPFTALADLAANKVAPVELLRTYPLIVDGQKFVVD